MPSKKPGSISSAVDLQIGHIAIAFLLVQENAGQRRPLEQVLSHAQKSPKQDCLPPGLSSQPSAGFRAPQSRSGCRRHDPPYTAAANIYPRYILAQKRNAKFDSGFVPLLH
jgi:hypothetical protein